MQKRALRPLPTIRPALAQSIQVGINCKALYYMQHVYACLLLVFLSVSAQAQTV